jgi:CrcB protein
MKNLFLVGIGGLAGTLLRYGISTGMNQLIKTDFPLATLVINGLGCFLIGYCFQLSSSNPNFDWIKPFMMIGLLGGFTTFSSFALEGNQLFGNGQTFMAVLYILASNVLGYLAAYWGSVTSVRFEL